jgi:DMSO/TMAO reductase YedYZ heme-binding membrane subunit/ferredoxin
MRSEEAGVHLLTASVGFLSFFLLWLSVVWGLALRNGWMATRVRHQTLYGSHQVLALLGLTLAAIHAFGQLAVPGTFLRLVDLLVPFVFWRDPIGVGVGVLALEVLTAVSLSILVQRRLGYTRWRMLHRLTYPAFSLAAAHVLISGTDLGPSWIATTILLAWLVTVGLWFATIPWVVEAWQRLRGRFVGVGGAREVAINVDPTRCARFGFCEHEAPAVFVLRNNGLLSHRATVPVDELAAVSRAVEVCPTRAIAIAAPPGRLP